MIVIDPPFASKERFLNRNSCIRADRSTRIFRMRGDAEHSAVDLLPEINVPVLVVGGEQDVFTPYFLSNQMLRSIPVQNCEIQRGSHAALTNNRNG
jgi:pimeloyl-ACP methyl ester carboxylesterase